MIIYEYSVKAFNKTITAVGFAIDDIATCFPSADSITLAGTHYFIGDGTSIAQSLTKATPVAAAFTGSSGASSGASHTSIPSPADLTVVKPASIAFVGPAAASAWIWEMDGMTTLYDQTITSRFEVAGTYIMKLRVAGDGGEAVQQFMKITVT